MALAQNRFKNLNLVEPFRGAKVDVFWEKSPKDIQLIFQLELMLVLQATFSVGKMSWWFKTFIFDLISGSLLNLSSFGCW